MKIYPAIDLLGGQVVRLRQGDYAQRTVYGEDPAQVAQELAAQGAEAIHVVDLDAAKSGTPENREAVLAIKQASGVFCEIGGGIRNMETLRSYVEAGIDRVILGTAAVTNPEFLAQALEEYGEHVAVGVDAKDGIVRTAGWLEGSGLEAREFCVDLARRGVRTLIVTDISQDGMMAGTNLELYRALRGALSVEIVASGGVSSLDDVTALARLGLEGAIIGKAYYTGAIDLRAAIAAGAKEGK